MFSRPRQIGGILIRHGHDAVPVKSELPTTATDPEVFQHAGRTDRILITCNRDDFLVLAANADHPGLIIMKIFYTPTPPAPGIDSVTVPIPRALALDGQLFARLAVSVAVSP